MSVNKAILVGNVGKDPEVRYLEGGASVASFSLATTEVYKNIILGGPRVRVTKSCTSNKMLISSIDLITNTDLHPHGHVCNLLWLKWRDMRHGDSMDRTNGSEAYREYGWGRWK